MNFAVKCGWISFVIISALVFSIALTDSDNWYRTKIKVQEEVYDYVPASQLKILGCWGFVICCSVVAGGGTGIVIYGAIQSSKEDC